MDKEMIPEEEYSKVYSDMKELAQALSSVFDNAYAIYSPMVKTKIKDIDFTGNDHISTYQLYRSMKKTKALTILPKCRK